MRIHLLNNDRHSGKYGPAWKFIHLLLVKWKQNCFVLVKFLSSARIYQINLRTSSVASVSNFALVGL